MLINFELTGTWIQGLRDIQAKTKGGYEQSYDTHRLLPGITEIQVRHYWNLAEGNEVLTKAMLVLQGQKPGVTQILSLSLSLSLPVSLSLSQQILNRDFGCG